ncbi:MAG: choice-of-anchor H family protein [Candidatus Thiodiazotropha sp.]|jgi:hypothetical protein
MKKIMVWVAFGLILSGQVALAETVTERLTQSIEGPVSSKSGEVAKSLEEADIDISDALVISGNRSERLSQRSVIADYSGSDFTIFDAMTVTSRDDDDDGYYHRLKVVFDADVSSGRVRVYAKLYLSLEGGPWNHYFTSDTFLVDHDSSKDDYEVVTRLLDGYPPGYYDVLIELYDVDGDILVAEYGPNEDRDLATLPLEDRYQDDDGSDGGGGATGLGILLLGLIVPLFRKWRGINHG